MDVGLGVNEEITTGDLSMLPKRRLSQPFAMVSLICACSATLSNCAAPSDATQPDTEQIEIGETSQSLQLGYTGYVNVVQGSLGQNPAELSSAALRLTNVKPGMPHASCGATFVSKHHAVTAAHCVEHLALTGTFSVEEIEVSSFNSTELARYMTVVGDWDRGGFDNQADLTSGNGYHVVTHSGCRTTRRCDPSHGGREFCPITDNADIAMIRCLGRTFSNYAQTSSGLAVFGMAPNQDDITDLNVDIWWFHEIYNLPTSDDGSQGWLHYGRYVTSEPQANWHYQRYHQLLPVRSFRFPGNGPRYRTVKPGQDFEPATLNAIDAPVCHGTSGSGVFGSGTKILLGPVAAYGPASTSNNRLCENFTASQPGARRTYYVRAALTNSFVNGSPEVIADR